MFTDKQTNRQTDGRTLLVPKVAIATENQEFLAKNLTLNGDFFQIGDFSDYMEYGKIRPKGCLNICKGSHYWTNFLLLFVLKDGVLTKSNTRII